MHRMEFEPLCGGLERDGSCGGSPHKPSLRGEAMKTVGRVLALVLMAAALLSGCVVVPLGGWHGHWHGYTGGGHYQHYDPYPYRGR